MSARNSTPIATMSSFATYLIGFVILVIGLAAAAYLLAVPASWIGVGVIIMIGVGVLMATSRTRNRDPHPGSQPPHPNPGNTGTGTPPVGGSGYNQGGSGLPPRNP